jgi:type III secretion system FlhB-like substrate exporter
MRSKEFITEQQIDEINIKQALGTAALATGLGFGGLAYKYGTDTNQEPNTQRQSSGQVAQSNIKKAKPTKQVDMNAISKSDLVTLLKDHSDTNDISWQPNEFNQFLAQIFHETLNLDRMSENLYYTTPRVVYKTFTSSFRKNPKSIKNYLKNHQY